MRPKSPSQLEAAGAPAEAAELAETSEALGSARLAPECLLEPFARARSEPKLAGAPLCARPLLEERGAPKVQLGALVVKKFQVSAQKNRVRTSLLACLTTRSNYVSVKYAPRVGWFLD